MISASVNANGRIRIRFIFIRIRHTNVLYVYSTNIYDVNTEYITSIVQMLYTAFFSNCDCSWKKHSRLNFKPFLY